MALEVVDMTAETIAERNLQKDSMDPSKQLGAGLLQSIRINTYGSTHQGKSHECVIEIKSSSRPVLDCESGGDHDCRHPKQDPYYPDHRSRQINVRCIISCQREETVKQSRLLRLIQLQNQRPQLTHTVVHLDTRLRQW